MSSKQAEVQIYISPSIQAVFGEEIHDRVIAKLSLVPAILNTKVGEFNIRESRYNFLTPLRIIAPDILHEPGGIAKFEKICENLHGLLGLGRRSYIRYPIGLDHHWGTGIDAEPSEGIRDDYYTEESLLDAQRYLERAGVIKPPVAP